MTNDIATQSHSKNEQQYAQMKRSFELKDEEGLRQREYLKILNKVLDDLTRTRDPLLSAFWDSIELAGEGIKHAVDIVGASIDKHFVPSNIEQGKLTDLPQYKEDYYSKMIAIQALHLEGKKVLDGDSLKNLNKGLNIASQEAAFGLLSAEYASSNGLGATSLPRQAAAHASAYLHKKMNTPEAEKYIKFLPMVSRAIPDEWAVGKNAKYKWMNNPESSARKVLTELIEGKIERKEITHDLYDFAAKAGIVKQDVPSAIQDAVESFVVASAAIAAKMEASEPKQDRLAVAAQQAIDKGIVQLGITASEHDYLIKSLKRQEPSMVEGVQSTLSSLENVYRARGDEVMPSLIAEMSIRFSQSYNQHRPEDIADTNNLNVRSLTLREVGNAIFNRLSREIDQTGRIETESDSGAAAMALKPELRAGQSLTYQGRKKEEMAVGYYERFVKRIDQKVGHEIERPIGREANNQKISQNIKI